MKKIIMFLLAVQTLSMFEAKASSPGINEDKPQSLVFGMAPVVGVKSTYERFLPLSRFISEKIDHPIELLVTQSYGELIDKVWRGQVDIVKLSPLAYVRAKARIPKLKLIATQVANGSVTYSSYIVSVEGNKHASQKTIRGARICFADPDSTSGYLFPLAWLIDRGIEPRKDFSDITFGGSHRECLKGLFEGRWDLAATWAGAIRDARTAGMDVGEMLIIAKTGRIPFDAWCLRPGLDSQLSNRISKTLVKTNTLSHEGRKVLLPTLGINGWIPASDDIYEIIRTTERQVKVIRESLCKDH